MCLIQAPSVGRLIVEVLAYYKRHRFHYGVGVPVDKAEYTVGPWLTFDPKTERFTGDHAETANVLVKDNNNKGFEVPDVKNV
jgi:hypothetical protein